MSFSAWKSTLAIQLHGLSALIKRHVILTVWESMSKYQKVLLVREMQARLSWKEGG